MIAIGIIIIMLLIAVECNMERLVNNAHTINKYLNDINNKLDGLIQDKEK